jgi:hypothetical protein
MPHYSPTPFLWHLQYQNRGRPRLYIHRAEVKPAVTYLLHPKWRLSVWIAVYLSPQLAPRAYYWLKAAVLPLKKRGGSHFCSHKGARSQNLKILIFGGVTANSESGPVYNCPSRESELYTPGFSTSEVAPICHLAENPAPHFHTHAPPHKIQSKRNMIGACIRYSPRESQRACTRLFLVLYLMHRPPVKLKAQTTGGHVS